METERKHADFMSKVYFEIVEYLNKDAREIAYFLENMLSVHYGQMVEMGGSIEGEAVPRDKVIDVLSKHVSDSNAVRLDYLESLRVGP